MRVGLVRNVALGMVALVGLGLAGCDDNPTDFDADETVRITTNPTVLTLQAGETVLLSSRTENAGNEPTWEEISASVDGSCGSGALAIDVAATYEPSIQPPGQFDVTGGTTMGETCIALSGGGANATVEVTVVGENLEITGAPEFLDLNASVDLGAVLRSSDGTAVSPFDDATDVVWSSDDEDVLTVDENGVVTAVAIGGATITATWTGFGVTVSASVPIAVNAPTIEIVEAGTEDPPEPTLLFGTSVDLDANLVNPTDPPAEFGPFDQTDFTWSSSNVDVVEVDAATGEATAVGIGVATITATWTGNESVVGSVDIEVTAPAPTLVSTDVSSASAGEIVTVIGTDLIPGAHVIFVDGDEVVGLLEPDVTSATTATFRMPPGANVEVAITVGIPGDVSNALTVTRTGDTEPANDDPGTPTSAAVPIDLWGFVSGSDPNDFYEFTLAADATIHFFMEWEGSSDDLDLIQDDTGLPFNFPCGFPTATASVPEEGDCSLAAGTYILWVNSYDGGDGVYHVTGEIVP